VRPMRCSVTPTNVPFTTRAATRLDEVEPGELAASAGLVLVGLISPPLMDAMFGGQAAGRGPRSRTQRGQDALVRTGLELHEAVFGCTKSIRIDAAVVCPRCQGSGGAPGSQPVTCSTCHGQGEVTTVQRSFIGDIRTAQRCPTCQGFGTIIPEPCVECSGEGRVRSSRDVSVRIPAGVSTGNRIHLEGRGEVGRGGGPAGDLYVELVVAEHDRFRRDGDNLETVVTLPMTAAALGTSIDVKTLEAGVGGLRGGGPEGYRRGSSRYAVRCPDPAEGARCATAARWW